LDEVVVETIERDLMQHGEARLYFIDEDVGLGATWHTKGDDPKAAVAFLDLVRRDLYATYVEAGLVGPEDLLR